jgi:DNA polymerase III subunit beta
MTDTDIAIGSGMKVNVSRDELVQKLSVVSRAVSARTTVLVLGGVLLRAENGVLSLAATDMELSLRTSLDAQVDGAGAAVVPGKMLVELVRLLPDEDVEIEHRAEEGVVRVESGSYSSRLHTYNVEDFPRLPDVAAGAFAVDKDALLDTVARVSRSASRDESRPVLTGILARFEGGNIVMAATDSYRLSVKETPMEGEAPELEAIIPARALTEVSRIAAGADTLELGVQENQVVFVADDVTLTTRRIEGQFPNYKQLIPESYEQIVALPRTDVLEVVRRVGVMAQRNSPIRLRFAEGELTVSAQTQDVGESHESMPVAYAGEAMEIGFNADYLRDGFESVTGDTAHFKLISPLRPAVIQGESDDFTYLVMPIRLPST